MERISFKEVRRQVRTADTVCLLAPLPSAEDPRDGYIRRIKAVDETALASFIRVYLMGDRPDLTEILAQREDERHYYLRFNSADAHQRRQIFQLIRASGRLYVHSVYRFVAGPVSLRMLQTLTLRGVKLLWDVHGAVPEEIELTGARRTAFRAAVTERLLYKKSHVMICVSRAMAEHLRSKYGRTRSERILLPIFDASGSPRTESKPVEEKPAVVYAGGLQGWQGAEAMIALADQTWERYDYRFFVPDPAALKERWGNGPGKEHVVIASRSPEEMDEAYAPCIYGLLLREDTPINRVACPTKLIEYVSHGVIPVLRTAGIGDLGELGFAWVTEGALLTGSLPGTEALSMMRERNDAALARLMEQNRRGMDTLGQALK